LDYNNFTYILSKSRAFATYKDLILNLVHPSGMRLIGRNLINTSNNINMTITDDFQSGVPLEYVAGSAAYATLAVDKTTNNISNNIIKFTNVISGNIGNTIFANDVIEFTATNNIRAYSTITRVDWSNNQVYMRDNVYLTFANVAYGYVSANSNVINITTLTGQYDGNFGTLEPLTPANSFINVGDTVSFNSNTTFYTVTKFFANGNFSINGAVTPGAITPSVNTAAVVVGILSASFTGTPANTLFYQVKVGGRSIGDINGTDNRITSADSLQYEKWRQGVSQPAGEVTWITETLNPYILANPVTYSDYINNLETANTRITVNKNANTQSVMI
jgi:hypothetical protein